MEKFSDLSPIEAPQLIILGIFGNWTKITENELQEDILNPVVQELGRVPDRILIPTEGVTSIYIQEWAESMKISYQMYQADWKNSGRSAQILRDNRIRKECTHALVFLSPRSDKLEKSAEAMAKNGKRVFTSSWQTGHTLEELCCEQQKQPPSAQASKHAHKSDKGTMLTWLKYQKKAVC